MFVMVTDVLTEVSLGAVEQRLSDAEMNAYTSTTSGMPIFAVTERPRVNAEVSGALG